MCSHRNYPALELQYLNSNYPRFPKSSKYRPTYCIKSTTTLVPSNHVNTQFIMSHLRQEDLRAFEQTRQRLYQLSQSIGSLKADVLRTSPMPAWYLLTSPIPIHPISLSLLLALQGSIYGDLSAASPKNTIPQRSI